MDSMQSVFQKKYEEFAKDLEGTCPELSTQIQSSLTLSKEDRLSQFKSQVLPYCSPQRNPKEYPNIVLPGVSMPESLWHQLSKKSKNAVQEYLTLLGFCCLVEGEQEATSNPAGWTKDFAEKMMGDMKEKMGNFDFSGFADKFKNLFGADMSGSFPKLPEKFMKGQIAKLAEEIVKEFKIEDFGLSEEQIKAAGDDPTKALGMIMEVFSKNPEAFQKTIMKMGKKLQAKVQSGALRPQELVAEAEELMKTFSENPQFVEMMETFRSTFGFEDKDMAQAAGRDGENRLSLAQKRLRAKLEAKKKNKK